MNTDWHHHFARAVVGIGLVTVLSGCAIPFLSRGPETIAVPIQQARNVYATLRTYYLDWKAVQDAKCQANTLPASECVKLAEAHEEVKKLDFEIRRGLENPKAETDWGKLARILEVMARLTP